MKSKIDVGQLFGLGGRVAILTGATGYFGRVFARALCTAGAEVILVARGADELDSIEKELVVLDHKVSTYVIDLRDDDAIQKFCEEVVRQRDRIDILVNNAYSGKAGTVESATPDAFRAAYDVTVTATFRLVQLLQPLLSNSGNINAGGASVINVASMYGTVSPDPAIYGDSGSNNPPYYGAAKAGLIQLSRYLACHLADSGIRVNSISPGPFPPPSIALMAPQFHMELCRKTPMGRIGLPEELIGALLFLASDASSFVTGINLPVDGGWTAW